MMMRLSDYTYYRISLCMKNKIKNWKNSSIVLISLLQTSIILYPIITILKFNDHANLISAVGIAGMILFIIISILNEYRYSMSSVNNGMKTMHDRMSSNLKKIYGFIIALLLFLVFFYAPVLMLMTGAKFV